MASSSPSETLRDRAAFYASIRKVGNGMGEKDVERILGRPDDIRRPTDPTALGDKTTHWCYGTDKHLGLPTLGYVCFLDGKVLYRSSPDDKPFNQLVPEAELRFFLQQISPQSRSATPFDPLWMIRSVNALQPLGAEKALFVLNQFCQAGGEIEAQREDVFGLAQVLFSGDRVAPSANGAASAPFSPIVVVNDMPFQLLGGLPIGGAMPGLSSALPYYRQHGILRSKPLTPYGDPFVVEQSLRSTPEWQSAIKKFGDPQWAARDSETEMNVRVLIRSIVPVLEGGQPGPTFDDEHKAFLAAKGHWDQTKEMYVRGDGSGSIPEPVVYPKTDWKAGSLPPLKLEMMIHRTSPHQVDWTIDYSGSNSAPHNLQVRAIDVATRQLVFEQTQRIGKDLNPGIPGANNGAIISGFDLPVGQHLYFELSMGKSTLRSPVYQL